MGVAADETKQRTNPKADDSSSGDPRVVYKPRPETTPDSEARALANVYAFVLDRHHERRVTIRGDDETSVGRKDTRRPSEDERAGEGSA